MNIHVLFSFLDIITWGYLELKTDSFCTFITRVQIQKPLILLITKFLVLS